MATGRPEASQIAATVTGVSGIMSQMSPGFLPQGFIPDCPV